MANIQYSVATTIQSTLQGSVTLTSSDNEVAAIDTTNGIVVRKMGLREQGYEIGHLLEIKPGILVVPTSWRSPPEAGNDQNDDVFYDYDLIIIVQDNHIRVAGLNTYCQWQQNIRHYFNEGHTRVSWPTGNGGIILNSWATSSEGLNDWRWVNQAEATIGVRVMVKVRESRG